MVHRSRGQKRQPGNKGAFPTHGTRGTETVLRHTEMNSFDAFDVTFQRPQTVVTYLTTLIVSYLFIYLTSTDTTKYLSASLTITNTNVACPASRGMAKKGNPAK
jgi:hypothetical protein